MEGHQFLSGLLGQAHGERPIAFIGAGASVGLYPLWNELIERLATFAIDRGVVTKEKVRAILAATANQQPKAAQKLKDLIGDSAYREFLRETFRTRLTDEGKPYTETQAALMRLPFRAYITTNYDDGLVEARAAFKPSNLRQLWFTWNDKKTLAQWQQREIFSPSSCPILFAHGHIQRPESVVLGIDEYKACYREKAFEHVFANIFSSEHIVFVGFSFKDAYLEMFVDGVLERFRTRSTDAPLRHVAILPRPDDPVMAETQRELYQEAFDAHIIFYPVFSTEAGEDHRALLTLLSSFDAAVPRSQLPQDPDTPESAHTERPLCVEKWCHGTTDDSFYVERGLDLMRLDRFSDDPRVKTIGIIGIGGLGKTSLVGFWLKHREGLARRPYVALFSWSFYENASTKEMLAALFDLARQLGIIYTSPPKRQAQFAANILRQSSILVLLDGLEVLQFSRGEVIDRAGRNTVEYGDFLDQDLSEFLSAYNENDGLEQTAGSLILLTSRFPFQELERFAGISFAEISLNGLPTEGGIKLLERLGVIEPPARKAEIVRELQGHPLALRVYALAWNEAGESSTKLFHHVFVPTSGRNRFEDKLGRVFSFYDSHLPRRTRDLLGLVGLFRSAVSQSALQSLASINAVRESFLSMSSLAWERELDALVRQGLLFREMEGVSCHPILRDHYRSALLDSDPAIATDFASRLANRPSSDAIRTVTQIEPILDAISALVQSRKVDEAHKLYTSRLVARGEAPARISRPRGYEAQRFSNVFLDLPAIRLGLSTSMEFVAHRDRRRACVAAIGNAGFAFYLSEVYSYALQVSELKKARQYLRFAAKIARVTDSDVAIVNARLTEAQLLGTLGEFELAREAAIAALTTEHPNYRPNTVKLALLHLMNIARAQGHYDIARNAFLSINEYLDHAGNEYAERFTIRSKASDILLAYGEGELARELVVSDLSASQQAGWQDESCRCQIRLARIYRRDMNFPSCENVIDEAIDICKSAQMDLELCEALLERGKLRQAQGKLEEARHSIDDSLRIATKGYAELHVAGLVARANISLQLQDAEGAFNDAELAFRRCRSLDLWDIAPAAATVAEEAAMKVANGKADLFATYRMAAEARRICTPDWRIAKQKRWKPGKPLSLLQNFAVPTY